MGVRPAFQSEVSLPPLAPSPPLFFTGITPVTISYTSNFITVCFLEDLLLCLCVPEHDIRNLDLVVTFFTQKFPLSIPCKELLSQMTPKWSHRQNEMPFPTRIFLFYLLLPKICCFKVHFSIPGIDSERLTAARLVTTSCVTSRMRKAC